MAEEITRQLGESIQDFTKRRALILQRAEKPDNKKRDGGKSKPYVPSEYWRYPMEAIFQDTDYMRFRVIKYQAPGISTRSVKDIKGNPIGGLVKSSQDKAGSPSKIKEKTLARIDLPMPMQLGDRNSVAWSKGDMNSIAALVGSFAEELVKNPDNSVDIAQYLGNIGRAINRTMQSSQAAGMGGLVQVGKAALVNVMVNMIPGTGNFGFNEALARQGVVINPNTEFLFRGPQLRNFAFAYTFVARNEKEGQHIKEIIRNFKIRMAPKKTLTAFGSGNNVGGGFLQAPDIFQIEYMKGEGSHPYLNKFKLCALTDLQVNYSTGGGYMSYEDGTPVVITMAMSFTELTPIYAEDYFTKVTDENGETKMVPIEGVGY